MSSNKRKSEFLSMPHGTAAQRLRKSILFQLVKETNRDACFRCKTKITSVEELSIDHKLPWEGISVKLFWDLENIAFSHLKCNRPHNNGAIKRRKLGLDGTFWCSKCKEFLPSMSFSSDKSRWSGKPKLCKLHLKEKRKQYRKT